MHLHRPAFTNRSDENVTLKFRNDYDAGSLSDFNVGVRVQRAVIRDVKPPDVVDDEPGTGRMSAQLRDEHQGKAFALTGASGQLASTEKDYV